MKTRLVVPVVTAFALAACGGGGSDTAPGGLAGPAYRFITPVAGSKNVFAETLVDNLNNTLSRTVIENVTAVNADGSFTTNAYDPSSATVISGAVNHTFFPTAYSYNKFAQELGRTVLQGNGGVLTCIDSPSGGSAPSPLAIGQTWNISFTDACGTGAATAYSRSGAFMGTETVTVPAGTFVAYKLQSTITWTTARGTPVTASVTLWRNAAGSDSRELKLIETDTYGSNAVPAGTIVSYTRVLQSSS